MNQIEILFVFLFCLIYFISIPIICIFNINCCCCKKKKNYDEII